MFHVISPNQIRLILARTKYIYLYIINFPVAKSNCRGGSNKPAVPDGRFPKSWIYRIHMIVKRMQKLKGDRRNLLRNDLTDSSGLPDFSHPSRTTLSFTFLQTLRETTCQSEESINRKSSSDISVEFQVCRANLISSC